MSQLLVLRAAARLAIRAACDLYVAATEELPCARPNLPLKRPKPRKGRPK